MSTIASLLLALLAYLLGRNRGWHMAHKTVATDCEKLGAFYYGDRVFKCTEVSNRSEEQGATDGSGSGS